MKKILLSLTVLAMCTNAFAQLETTGVVDLKKQIDNAKSQIAKSDAEIQDAKKANAVKTWEKRALIFSNAAKINTQNTWAGMTATSNELFNNLQTHAGQPQSKATEKINQEEYEVWTYPTIKYYIKDNVINFWEETVVADPEALDKAYQAYQKAIEIDPKGTFKTAKKTIDEIKDLKKQFYDKGVNDYLLQKYDNATKAFEGGLKSAELIGLKDSTIGQTAYYGGLSAKTSGDNAKAIKFFEKSIENDYAIGSCYHNIFEIYTANNESEKAFKTITEAYDKYPQEEQILYDVINYYLGKKQTEEAETYLNKAIEKYPENKGLYSVKAQSIYFAQYTTLKDEYLTQKEQARDLGKKVFQNRNNAKEKERYEKEQAIAEQNAEVTKQKALKNWNEAEKIFNDLNKDSKNFDAAFMLGYITYDKSELAGKEKDLIPLSEKEKSNAKEAEQKELWQKSLDYFKIANQIKPTDTSTLQNMRMLYQKLGQYDKVKEIKEKLEQM